MIKKILIGLAATAALPGCMSANDQIAERAKKAAKERLRDPDSAKFQGLMLYKVADKEMQLEHPQANATRDVICGEINATNAYGGMIGYSPFVVVLGPQGKDFDSEVFFSSGGADQEEEKKFISIFGAACMGNGIKVGS